MRNATAMTLRLPEDPAMDLAIVAEVDDEPVSEAIRAAVAAWMAKRRLDPAFQEVATDA